MAKKCVTKKRLNKKNVFILVLCIVFFAICIKGLISHKGNDTAKSSNVSKTNVNITTENTNANNSKKKFTVVVDASYGGSDGGSRGYNGIIQKNINLDLALKIRDKLKRFDDINVILTRDKDVTVSMDKRINFINDSNADFLVSIMQNNEGTGNVSGVETYVLPRENPNSNTTLGYTLQQAMTMYVDTTDRGVLAKNMAILINSNIPGAVVNTGFISNKIEGSNLASDKYQERMAEGIAQGILSYVDKHLKK